MRSAQHSLFFFFLAMCKTNALSLSYRSGPQDLVFYPFQAFAEILLALGSCLQCLRQLLIMLSALLASDTCVCRVCALCAPVWTLPLPVLVLVTGDPNLLLSIADFQGIIFLFLGSSGEAQQQSTPSTLWR